MPPSLVLSFTYEYSFFLPCQAAVIFYNPATFVGVDGELPL